MLDIVRGIRLKDKRLQLALVTFLLVMIGLTFVQSTSGVQAVRLHKGEMYFLLKQLVGCGVGLVLLLVAYKIPLDFYRRYIKWIFSLTIVLLIAVFFFRSANGAHRWIMLPVFSFQPSELAKFTVVLYLAHYFDKKYDLMADLMRGFFPATFMVGVLAALVLVEPDFGTTFLIVLVVFTMFVVGGVKARHIFGVFAFVAPILMACILLVGYRKGRLLSFLDPWADKFGTGYQLTQSFAAVGSGGFLGKGVGNSTQKLLFLPEANTDFIYAIIAEEWGFVGAIFVLFLIILFFRIVIKSALNHSSRYKKLLMIGLACILFYQSAINIAVVLGMLPTKGFTLPFISYGGSALMMSLFFLGVIMRGISEEEI
ncbi:MAG: putative lipid II flippase FtsW [Deferribacteraceae bacterium]|jgi:cell division protein FtsW|nr:putative lipid II flippase FtsW [Deferribacteraceae bacterium]